MPPPCRGTPSPRQVPQPRLRHANRAQFIRVIPGDGARGRAFLTASRGGGEYLLPWRILIRVRQRYSDSVRGHRKALSCWLWKHRQPVCAGMALVLYLIGLGRPPLWEPDEGRYAEIAREMVVNHDYITPRNNFVRYFEKPPLVYWITAASLRVFGHNEFAVRLQAAVASAGQVAITGALGERMFGPTTGLLGAVALALSPLFFAFARFATPDPALALFITAAMACFYIGAESVEVAGAVSGWWIVTGAAMLALGTLTKGLVALFLGGIIVLLWLILTARTRILAELPWLRSIGLYLALSLPWFVVVARRNPGFLQFFIIHEHLQRYLQDTEHGWGPWFYIPIAIAGTWPWFYFVPFAVGASICRPALSPARANMPLTGPAAINRQPPKADPVEGHTRDALRFLIIWFAVVLVFFSIPRAKLGEYILPGLPPIAVLSAYGLARIEQLATMRRRRIWLIFAAINIVAATAITCVTIITTDTRMSYPRFTQAVSGDALVIAGGLLTVGLISPILAGYSAGAVRVALAISVLIEIGAAMDARQRVAPMVSYRNLARLIDPYVKRGCRLMSYGHFEQALPFYTGTRETLVNYRGELGPFGPVHDPDGRIFSTIRQLKQIWGGEQCTVLVVNRSDLPSLTKMLSPMPTVIGCEGKKLAVYNRPAASSAQNTPVADSCGQKF